MKWNYDNFIRTIAPILAMIIAMMFIIAMNIISLSIIEMMRN